ncbi:MAG: hypothetical protein ACLU9L_05370 [Christensenellales bacterium]
MKKKRWTALCCFVALCVAGCVGQPVSQENQTGAERTATAPLAQETPYPQAEIPVPSFSAEQLEAMGLPEDLSEESIASMQYIYGNQEIGMMISVPIYWMQVKPENGAPNQCYFYLRADEENITSFSISSQDYVLENGTEEAVIKAFVENEWKNYQALQKELNGKPMEIQKEQPLEIVQIGNCLGGKICYEYNNGQTDMVNEFIVWVSKEKRYCCTLMAKPAYSKYAKESLAEILAGFEEI